VITLDRNENGIYLTRRVVGICIYF